MKSIMSTNKECYICGLPNVHKHHVFGGPNRKISEENGFWVYLCPFHHNMSDCGVHFDKSLDLEIKQACQMLYERKHTREEFMRLIGRNYLEN